MAGALSFLGGYLRIKISGNGNERFLNLCAARQIELWDISFREGAFEAGITLKNFWKLRPIVRKTKIKVAVLEKNGLPFFVPKLRKQWSFIVGMIFAFLFWFVSSFFVWEIKCNGNVQVTRDQLMTFLEIHEVKLGSALAKLNFPYLEKELRRNFPQIVWTSMKRDGTKLIIDIKENELENVQEDHADSERGEEGESGSDIIGSMSGTIVSMIVRKGIPKVRIGDEIVEGQILVEGAVPIFSEDGSIMDAMQVKADADIYLQHTILWEDEIPLEYLQKEYSGRVKTDYFMIIGDQKCEFAFGKPFYKETEIECSACPAILEEFGIPMTFGKKSRSEYLPVRKKLSLEEQKNCVSEKITQFLSTLEEKGVQIIEKNVKIENGSKYIKLHGEFLVTEKLSN